MNTDGQLEGGVTELSPTESRVLPENCSKSGISDCHIIAFNLVKDYHSDSKGEPSPAEPGLLSVLDQNSPENCSKNLIGDCLLDKSGTTGRDSLVENVGVRGRTESKEDSAAG